MRVVIALGGNAIVKRGELLTTENQRQNVRRAAIAIGQVIAAGHEVIVTHGNGPQVGLMALQVRPMTRLSRAHLMFWEPKQKA